MSAVTILIADDHQMVREGLRSLLEAEANFKVVGEAGDGLAAVRLATQLQPRIVVLDLMMPKLRGVEAARQIRQRVPRSKVIIVSMYGDESFVIEALRAGAHAYVLKEAAGSELIRAIREAEVGRHYLSPPLSEAAIHAYKEKAEKIGSLDIYEQLSPRERQVLQLTAEGCTSGEIAAQLSISSRTAETHRANILRKLNLRSQADMIRFALQRGVLPLHKPPPES